LIDTMLQARALFTQAGLVQRAAQGAACSLKRGFASKVGTDDTHDDFKPQYKAEPVSDVNKLIEGDVKSNTVFVYMKGVPDAPQCGFSNMACRVLDAYGVKYGARNVLSDPNLREGIKKFTNWPTIPQVFVKGEFIGGADILMNMHNTGELEKVLGPIVKEQGGK